MGCNSRYALLLGGVWCTREFRLQRFGVDDYVCGVQDIKPCRHELGVEWPAFLIVTMPLLMSTCVNVPAGNCTVSASAQMKVTTSAADESIFASACTVHLHQSIIRFNHRDGKLLVQDISEVT